MLKNKDIVIDSIKTLGEKLLLASVSPNMYANGNRLAEPNGYKYNVCSVQHQYEQISVLILGEKLMDTPPMGATVFVVFDNLVLTPYIPVNGRSIALSARAEGIHVASKTEEV